MSFNYLILTFFTLIFTLSMEKIYAEPFIVLEYRKSADTSGDNSFITNENFSSKHKVKKNETLTDIILKHYGFKYFNKGIISFSIVHFNKHAFVRKNPNFLFANKTLYLPSIREIKDLVIKKQKKSYEHKEDRKNEIYFFGG